MLEIEYFRINIWITIFRPSFIIHNFIMPYHIVIFI
jgi:hypothetical protein